MLSVGRGCAVCGVPASCSHHIIHRVYKILRWDWRNCLPVCQECHNKIHNEGNFGIKVEMAVIGQEKMDFLRQLARPAWSKYLLNLGGMTEAEFYRHAELALDEQLDNKVRYECRGMGGDLPF